MSLPDPPRLSPSHPPTSTVLPASSPSPTPAPSPTAPQQPIRYETYTSERQLPALMALIDSELSEPYINMTYRYFLRSWPHLAFLAYDGDTEVGVVVCKQDRHKRGLERGYIAMLSVRREYRKRGIATELVKRAITEMKLRGAQEIILETETDNATSLSFYARLGFIREKRLYRFYMNGKDAFRLCLAVPPPGEEEEEAGEERGRKEGGAMYT